MKQIVQEQLTKAWNLYKLTYNTKTVEEMIVNSAKYHEYVKFLTDNYEVEEQYINDYVWNIRQEENESYQENKRSERRRRDAARAIRNDIRYGYNNQY